MWTEATEVVATVTPDNPEGLDKEVSPNFRSRTHPGVGNVTNVLLLIAEPDVQSSLRDTSGTAPRQTID